MFLNANSRVTGGIASRRAFPAGTQMMFVNAAAPVGWVRVSTFDDALLRIVGSAVPGSGGSSGFVATFNAQTGTGTGTTGTATTGTGTTGGHSITQAELPNITLNPNNTNPNFLNASVGTATSIQAGTGASILQTQPSIPLGGSGTAHSHSVPGLSIPGLSVPSLSITTAIKYVDALIAKKS
jgi:hypothetical protein